jgi:hypothetical protein
MFHIRVQGEIDGSSFVDKPNIAFVELSGEARDNDTRIRQLWMEVKFYGLFWKFLSATSNRFYDVRVTR